MRKVLTRGQAGKPSVRGCALASASVLCLVVIGAGAQAQPVGGSVVAGQAQISSSGATTLINQSTPKAIINWQSFSVGQGSSVQFNQPGSSAITLNRVTGTGASAIDGAIRANGQVWLLNPNGLLFGAGATINVGGLLATSSDIADQDFLAGRYNFSSTGGKGAITNAGSITASSSVVLSAPTVTNKGLVQAQAGHVVLGGTDTFTVDFEGDHLLSYAIGPTSSGGKVSNSGKLAAAGGTILLTARAAAGVQDAVINNTGMVEATSVREQNGEIILEADNGTVADSGTLDASGTAAGETGGTVKVLGQQVAVADGAKIDVSGDAGGGTALVGGNLHGAGPEPNAQTTSVGKALINASAITSGNGGTVAVYSTGTTTVSATITAEGGITSGKGGMVETSGHSLGVSSDASVNTLAPHGTPGDWLLDPQNLTISSTDPSPGNDTQGTLVSGVLAFGANGVSNDYITPATIVSALGTGNVTLQANQDITVNSPILTTTNNTLELDAGHSIILNAAIRLNQLGESHGASSNLILSANDPGGTGNAATASITLNSGELYSANLTLKLAGASNGIGTAASPLPVDYADNAADTLVLTVASGSSVYLTSQADHTQISAAGVNVGANTFSLIDGVGPILQASGGSITASTINLQTTAGVGGGGIGGTGSVAGTPINVGAPSGTLSLSLATTGDLANINSTSAVALGTVNLGTTGSLTLTSTGEVDLPSLTIPGNLTLNVSGTGHPGILVEGPGAIVAQGTMSLTADGNIGAIDLIDLAPGYLQAPTVSLKSNFGVIGTPPSDYTNIPNAAPVPLSVVTNRISAQTGSQDINLSLYDLAGTGIAIGEGIAGGRGINAGTGNVTLTATNALLQQDGLTPIIANNLNVTVQTSVSPPYGVTSTPDLQLGNTNNAVNGTVTLTSSASITFNNGVNTTLGNISAAGSVTIGSAGSLSLAPAVTLSSGGDIILSATGNVSEDNTATITQSLSEGLFQITAGGNITTNAPTNVFASDIYMQAPGSISFTNSIATRVGTISNGILVGTESVPVAASSVNINVVGAGNTLEQDGGTGITAGSISLTTAGGLIGNLSTNNPLTVSGGPDGSGNADAASTALSVNSGGGNVYLMSHSPLSIGGMTLGGGYLVVNSYGNVTVNAPISTSADIIDIDSGGSIQVNAPITAAMNAGTPGAITLTANDINLNQFSGFASNSDTNGIAGSGQLTAGTVNLNVTGGQNGLSGGIGTQAQPLQVTSDTGNPLSLGARSWDGNVYINSTAGISVDNTAAALGSYGISLTAGLPGIITSGSNSLYGQVSLSAAGLLTQTTDIATGNLTLTSTSANANISFTTTSNSVFGQLDLNSARNATFFNGTVTVSQPLVALNVGASNVTGTLTLESLANDININDPGGGAVHAGSILFETARSANISISSPLISNTSIAMFAGGAISQNTSATTDAHIQAGTNFFARASTASITLADLGNKSGDPGNQIAGPVVLQGRAVVFANVPGITFGTDSFDNPSTPYSTALTTFTAITPGNITIAPGASISASSVGPAGIIAMSLQAGGNFINNSGLGQQTLLVGNTSYFNIYSANPATDVFGGLNSGNTAVWDTAAGGPVTAQANRYIFALQPTLTVAIGNQTKTYGTDDSVFLQSLAGAPTGLQPGVAGAFQGDTAAAVFSGTPAITSAGSAAGANVGTYAIIANLAVGDGYTITASGNLTVTPVTLFYNASALSRTYGSANLVFGGTVTGFVNGDTQASATSGTLAFTSLTTAGSGVGSYAINGSGLSAVNYVFAQNAANATALTITRATLTYTANTASRLFGAADPLFSGTVSGFVNGDTQTSATTGTLAFATAATSTSPAGSYSIVGSGLNAANYTFVQAPGNATALTITALPTAPPPIQLQSFTTSITPPPPQNIINTPLGATPLSVIALPVVPPPQPPPLPPPVPPLVDSPLADLSDTPIPSDQITSFIASSLGGGSAGDISSIVTGGEVTTNGGSVGSPAQNGNSDASDSGNSGSGRSNGGVVIPRMLVNAAPPPPPPTDISALSSFGNSSLWQ